MTTLDELALRHGTDKSSETHGFAEIYERFLSPLRARRVVILEIGVLDGASLRMWRDYFRNGLIFGVDDQPTAVDHESRRVQVFVGDQQDGEFLSEVVAHTGPLDLVIDDGGHRADQQLGSLFHLWPFVTPGGMYVIEDVHTSYLAPWGMSWRQPGTTMEVLKGIADDVNVEWHNQPVTLSDVESLHFYRELCLLIKRGGPATESQK